METKTKTRAKSAKPAAAKAVMKSVEKPATPPTAPAATPPAPPVEKPKAAKAEKANGWPAWYYGPGGVGQVFDSADEVPAGWVDHPADAADPLDL
jgi:hypothetical protein